MGNINHFLSIFFDYKNIEGGNIDAYLDHQEFAENVIQMDGKLHETNSIN